MPKAYLIDPFKKCITEVFVENSDDYCEVMHLSSCFCVGGRYRTNGKTDDLFVDDEGLYMKPTNQETQMFFLCPLFNPHQPLPGYGLVIGFDGKEDHEDVHISLDLLKASTMFIGEVEVNM